MDRLEALLEGSGHSSRQWVRGYIPDHYKRLTASGERLQGLAVSGGAVLVGDFGMKPYFTQSVIAGACMSPDISKVVVVAPSQYGKSYLMGRVALAMAYKGHQVHIVASTAPLTRIIMRHVMQAASEATPDIKAELEGGGTKIEKLTQSLSKQEIRLKSGGSVDALSLGDTFGDIGKNGALGRGGDYIVDEAALVSHEAFVELGRREFSEVDGRSDKLVMISNPHRAGDFYEALTEENTPEDTLVVWMDALTAVQEGRFTPEQVLRSDFAKDSFRRKTYLLCELDERGSRMLGTPQVGAPITGSVYLGVDAAYKGKDNIVVGKVTVGDGIRVDDVQRIIKGEWIDGVTGQSIVLDIARIYKATGARLVCVDVGYGAWIIEGLARSGVNVLGVNFGSAPTKERVEANHFAASFAANMRAELHLDLQDLIDSGKIIFSEEAKDACENEMALVTSQRKANGKIQVRPKAEIKAELQKSPDELDAVLLAIHAAIIYSGNQTEYIT